MKTNETNEKTRKPYTFAGYFEGTDKAQREVRDYLEAERVLHNAIISGGDTIEERRCKVQEAQKALKAYGRTLAEAQYEEETQYLDLEYAALEEAQYAKLEAEYEGYEL